MVFEEVQKKSNELADSILADIVFRDFEQMRQF
jgi:hypothetical protein